MLEKTIIYHIFDTHVKAVKTPENKYCTIGNNNNKIKRNDEQIITNYPKG